jgi:hypothetical protein
MTVAHNRICTRLLLLKTNILLFGQSGSLSSRLRGITQCLMSACFHVKVVYISHVLGSCFQTNFVNFSNSWNLVRYLSQQSEYIYCVLQMGGW